MGDIETDIFGRVIDPANPTLTSAAAEGILTLGYTDADHARMAELSAKCNGGQLTPIERRELQGYVFVGDLLSILKSKARLALRQRAAVV